MLLYVAVGLIPLAVLSTYAGPRLKKDHEAQAQAEAAQRALDANARLEYATREVAAMLRREFGREFTEFQHWRAPLNVQSQAPSVVRSPLADKPAHPLIGFYFQVRLQEQELQVTTPHLPEGDQLPLEQYQSQAMLPQSFEQSVREGCAALKSELPAILAAPVDGSAPPQGDIVQRFLAVRSGAKPSTVQVVSNDVLIVNSNAQEVANQARSAQVEKRQSRKDNSEDPWSRLRRPAGIDDPYGDSLVQVFPWQMYTRGGTDPRVLFWRTVRTPAEQLMQGFTIDAPYARRTWAPELLGPDLVPGWIRDAASPMNGRVDEAAIEQGAARLLALAFSSPKPVLVDSAKMHAQYARARDMLLTVGGGYALLLAMLGLFLYRAVSRSEALAQQQGEFVAAVSHELRTPLTAMRLFTELLIGQAKSAKNEKVEQHASRILAEEERLTRLVEMILLAAKIERGSFKVEIAEAPLGDALNAAVEAALRAHPGREIIVEARDLPVVKLDRAAAQQVFFNLIDNALKYSRDAGKPVRITSETRDGRLSVRIIDQGAGISEQDKPRLFQRFARGAKAGEQGAGTGLGLWLTREYARQMGWEVSLESKPGEGTTATVTLPLKA